MKLLLVTVAVAIVATLASLDSVEALSSISLMMGLHREPPMQMPRNARNLPYQYLDQRVDNFDPQNYGTYQQAYFENDQFFDTDGPLFMFIGGEWNISPSNMLAGHMFDMAAQHNGSLFYPEHRFYGRSFPTEDASTENLSFLSIEQSLADLASFIVQIKRRQPRYANSKVILVGGSYSATMVAWFRKQYPHLAVGAWASSAPVLAKVDFVEYKEIVGASIGSVGGQACYNRLEQAFAQAEQLIAENQTEEFRQLFGFCEDFGSHALDVSAAFSTLSDVLAGIVQYHSEGNIESLCEKLQLNETANAVSAFSQFFRDYVGLTDGVCIDNYWETVLLMRNTSLQSYAVRSNGRSWLYQTCTEFGWYQTSGSEYHPFGSSFPVDLYYELCRDIYGDQFTKRFIDAAIDRTNVVFGGWDLDVSNVYFTNGIIDPWRAMSIQEDLNELSPADVIPGASHVADLSSISGNDSVEMRQVKERISRLVFIWLVDLASN